MLSATERLDRSASRPGQLLLLLSAATARCAAMSKLATDAYADSILQRVGGFVIGQGSPVKLDEYSPPSVMNG